MATILLNSGRVKFIKITIKPIIFTKFTLLDKIDTKYEISVSELTPLPNLSLIPLKIEELVKSQTLIPKQRMTELLRSSGDITNFIMVSEITWDILALYKFCSDWYSGNGNWGWGGVAESTLPIPDRFSKPIQQHTELLNCFICTPGQLQGDVYSSPLVL